jgi:hypothetical protein
MDPTTLPSVLGGGSLVAVIVYLLRFISQLQRQLGHAQETAATRADERTKVAEAKVAELEERLRRIANPGDTRYREQQLEREARGDR